MDEAVSGINRDHVQTLPKILIQLTDCHLFASETSGLMGIQTRQSLRDVITLVRQRERQIDQIIVTGDISQDFSPESYHFCKEIVSLLKAPVAWLKGNHDDPQFLNTEQFRSLFPAFLKLGNWIILLLNTQLEKAIRGELSCDELEVLEEQLVMCQNNPVLIAMHHHPLPINSAWMDNYRLGNGDQLMTLLRGYPQVQAIVHGHIHQYRETIHNGIQILATPSTCLQFRPESDIFAVDDTQPGYRRVCLYPDGRFDTEVIRLPEKSWIPDHSQPGY